MQMSTTMKEISMKRGTVIGSAHPRKLVWDLPFSILLIIAKVLRVPCTPPSPLTRSIDGRRLKARYRFSARDDDNGVGAENKRAPGANSENELFPNSVARERRSSSPPLFPGR